MAEFYSLLFVALLDPFDPYSPFKFLIFYSSLNILHTMYFSYVHIRYFAKKSLHYSREHSRRIREHSRRTREHSRIAHELNDVTEMYNVLVGTTTRESANSKLATQ